MADDVYGFSEGDSKRISRTVRRVERSVDAGGGIPPQQSFPGGLRAYEGYLQEDLTKPVFEPLPSGTQALRATKAKAKIWGKAFDDPDDPDAPPIFQPKFGTDQVDLINRDPTLSGNEGDYVIWIRFNGENRPVYIGCSTANEVQRIEMIGDPTGGTFTLKLESEETGPIPYDVFEVDLQNFLEALPNVGPGNVTVDGGPFPGGVFDIEFIGELKERDIPLMSYDASGLESEGLGEVRITAVTEGCCG